MKLSVAPWISHRSTGKPLPRLAAKPCGAGSPAKCAVRQNDFRCNGYAWRRATPQRV